MLTVNSTFVGAQHVVRYLSSGASTSAAPQQLVQQWAHVLNGHCDCPEASSTPPSLLALRATSTVAARASEQLIVFGTACNASLSAPGYARPIFYWVDAGAS